MDFTLLLDLDMNDRDLNEFENDGGFSGFRDLLFSDSVAENNNTDKFNQETQINKGIYLANGSEDSAMASDRMTSVSDTEAESALIVDGQDLINCNLPYNLYEETLRTDKDVDTNENLFESINDDMYVIEQPKADRRSRYASDGIRFMPNSRKNPMSIHLPNLNEKPLNENQKYGIILTMVTSSNNPNQKTYVHVNEIKYHDDDTIPIGNGSIFIPITDFEIKNTKKTFSRLSIICKKYDHYSFELHAFDFRALNRPIETYTPNVEILPTKSAKGKQFTIDYDLLSYKFIFQLAVKQDDQYSFSSINCETNIINEQKNSLISKKQAKKPKNNRSLRKSKSNELPVIRRSTRMPKKTIKNIT